VWQRAPAWLRLLMSLRGCPRREEYDTAATSTGFTGGLPHARLGPPAAAHAGERGLARVMTPFPAQIPTARLVLTTGGWATRVARKPLSAATANGREGLLAAGPRWRPPVNSLASRSQPGQRTACAMALGSVAAAPGKDSAQCARRTSAARPRLGLPLSSPVSASQSSRRGRRSGTWSPTALELPNSRADGAAPGTRLPGDSSDEGIHGGSTSGRR
jgi:hypothetical protein